MTEERLKAIGAPVKADRLDVTEREAFQAYADAVNEHFGTVNQIYNNAGIAFTGDIEASQFKDIERVMDVDYWGVVNGTKVFLPHLIASGDGHVVNISSVFGLLAVPGQAAYNAAKFAVRGFTEALRQEMIVAGHPVKVTSVHPGGIKTGIARNMATAEGLDKDELAKIFDKRLASTSAQKAARVILDGVRRNKARVLVGNDAKALDLLVRVNWLGLPAGGRRGDIADDAGLAAALPIGSARRPQSGAVGGVPGTDTGARGKEVSDAVVNLD